MGWLLLLAAILGLIFPPLAFILLALMVAGVFAKGVQAESDPLAELEAEKRRNRRRWAKRRHPPESPDDTIIDVRSYPVPEEEKETL